MRRIMIIAGAASMLLGACQCNKARTSSTPGPDEPAIKAPSPPAAPVGTAKERLLAGRKAYNRGDFKAAETIFRGVVDQGQESAEAMVDLSRALSRLGERGPALKWINRAIQMVPEDTFARLNLAYMLTGQGRESEGVEFLRRSLDARPGDHRLLCALVDLIGKIEGSEPDMVEALKAVKAAGAKCEAGQDPLKAYEDVKE